MMPIGVRITIVAIAVLIAINCILGARLWDNDTWKGVVYTTYSMLSWIVVCVVGLCMIVNPISQAIMIGTSLILAMFNLSVVLAKWCT